MSLHNHNDFMKRHNEIMKRRNLPSKKKKWTCIIPGELISLHGITCGIGGVGNTPEHSRTSRQ